MKDLINGKLNELKQYDGKEIRIMEVCGSHTAAIARSGIRQILSPAIKLVSGPGCPVCVTPSAYIDRLIELAKQPDCCVVTFGDLMRVPGSTQSLNEAVGEGARVKMVYSPIDTIRLAREDEQTQFIFAAVGFETTTPVYALLLEQLQELKIQNVKILTALKTMPEAINWLCQNNAAIDGFLAPGHVSVITGSDIFAPLAREYQMPFVVAGFMPEELIYAIHTLVTMIAKGEQDKSACSKVVNAYPSVVSACGNVTAQEKVAKYFVKSDAVWRGMGSIHQSGLLLRKEYASFDAGSAGLVQDCKKNKACCCDKVLMGKMSSSECPLFKKVCNPQNPQGACMVSSEGSCYQNFITNG